ncbi:MAG: hypothetical protein ACI4KB_04825 [Oscillospiraceae bacterium]
MNSNNLKDAIGMLDDLLIDEAMNYNQTSKNFTDKTRLSDDICHFEPSVITRERKSILRAVPAVASAAAVFLIMLFAFKKNPDNNVNDNINISTSAVTTAVSSSVPKEFVSSHSDTHLSFTNTAADKYTHQDSPETAVSISPVIKSDKPANPVSNNIIADIPVFIPETSTHIPEISTEPATIPSENSVITSVTELSPECRITVPGLSYLGTAQYILSPEGIKKYEEYANTLRITVKEGTVLPKDEINQKLSRCALVQKGDDYEIFIGQVANREDVLNIILDYDEIAIIKENSVLKVYEDVYISYARIKNHHTEEELVSCYGEFLERFSEEKELNGEIFRTASSKINLQNIYDNGYRERLENFLLDSNVMIEYDFVDLPEESCLSKIIYESK